MPGINFEEFAQGVKAAWLEAFEKGYNMNHSAAVYSPEGAWLESDTYRTLLDRIDREGHPHPWQ